MSEEIQKLTLTRMDVDRIERGGDALMREGLTEDAIAVYALVMRLRTEAGWVWPDKPSNVVELRR